MGWTKRQSKYGREVCSSCEKQPNCVPPVNCKSERHHAYYELSRAKLKVKHWKTKSAVVGLLGGKCVNCGNTDIRVLQVNHKNHDGQKDPIQRSTTKFFTWILKGKIPREQFDLRCANCNILYEYESGRLSLPENFTAPS
jgi:hypothetical protein